MKKTESFPQNQEQTVELIPSVDVLAIIGHSIEHDKERGWIPTRFIQKLDTHGKRTGVRESTLDPDDDSAYVGGGNAVATAAAEMYHFLAKRGELPKAVSVVSGRPLYLEQAPPDVNEGSVMLEAFKRKAKWQPESKGELITLGTARNTAQELEQHLRMCVERGYTKIGFVLLDLRIERARALLNRLQTAHPEFSAVETSLISAETLLRHRYEEHPARLAEFEGTLRAFTSSKAHVKTVKDEQGGTQALKQDTYKGTGNY